MLGAIIGDLAAATWKNDRAEFYSSLVGKRQVLSPWGDYALRLAVAMINEDRIGKCPTELSWDERRNRATVMMALAGWLFDDEHEAVAWSLKEFGSYLPEKEGWYAINLFVPLVVSLRQGKTKDEAMKRLPDNLSEMLYHWDKQGNDMIAAVCRAWDAFYRWFDFTSVLHSAVKSPTEPRLTSILAGSLADAMYGCRNGFIKRKYVDQNSIGSFYIELPTDKRIDTIKGHDERVRKFFPKNNAMTNVERYTWTRMPNPYRGMVFYEDTFRRIKVALETGWENRYGIYLDNGWYYVYRSYSLLNRFKIEEEHGRYQITKVEKSNDIHVKDNPFTGLLNAIHSVQCPPYSRDPDEQSPKLMPVFKYFSLYLGEAKNPYEPSSEKGRIWHGEMFFADGQNLNEWREHAKMIRAKQTGESLRQISHLSDEELGIRLFIEELYRKWCPMDPDFSWIYREYSIY